ncbi:hypothetical protein [Tahibacter amnicola]|uniref:Uncharacterized protein n=1 Tax=Tahibacter amnicola TaxID=2976241 RepID=A0ABY6BFN1_9GAMM|nr:hypothetical protein [Tahibacter amnicola]UXI68062.1 hypothetical protein N4264_25605 [Tahibacter amnicola]UXI68068.1 hypothetical protein N4264_25635 [Tahibacter amnicola]
MEELEREVLQIEYALAKQIPSMSRGVELHTVYGSMSLHDGDAEKVGRLVEKLLYARLKQIDKLRRKAR